MLELRRLTVAHGGVEVLHGVEMSLGEGEVVGIVGPNGAGKTTLCRILARVDDPDTGQVSLPRSVTVGYLPQEAAGSASGSGWGPTTS